MNVLPLPDFLKRYIDSNIPFPHKLDSLEQDLYELWISFNQKFSKTSLILPLYNWELVEHQVPSLSASDPFCQLCGSRDTSDLTLIIHKHTKIYRMVGRNCARVATLDKEALYKQYLESLNNIPSKPLPRLPRTSTRVYATTPLISPKKSVRDQATATTDDVTSSCEKRESNISTQATILEERYMEALDNMESDAHALLLSFRQDFDQKLNVLRASFKDQLELFQANLQALYKPLESSPARKRLFCD
ncbi:hypothetical protein GEMRC1_012094 [Eukaryota sp. GEM-RC1]